MIHNMPLRQSTGHKTALLISELSHNMAVKNIIGYNIIYILLANPNLMLKIKVSTI